MQDDLLVVGFDLETQTEVHIGERPLEQWRTLGYGRRETVVCFYCWHGIDAPLATKVPRTARARRRRSRGGHATRAGAAAHHVVLPDGQEFSGGATVARGQPSGLHAAQHRFRRR